MIEFSLIRSFLSVTGFDLILMKCIVNIYVCVSEFSHFTVHNVWFLATLIRMEGEVCSAFFCLLHLGLL